MDPASRRLPASRRFRSARCTRRAGPPQLPGPARPEPVEAGTYKSDKNHSLVGWRVNHFGFNDYFGISATSTRR
jgi:hypothetical protein